MIENWKKIVVAPTISIRDSWKRLDQGGQRFIVVVDDDDHLFGVVTDGDIRRNLLAGRELTEPVELVMNRSPIVGSPRDSKSDLIDLMESHGILAVPLVDRGKLVGVAELQKLLQVSPVDNPVFIMAGGFGTRLRPLTDNCPKPMLNVGGRPLLDTLIRSFKRKGFRQFFISTHYLPEVIQDYFGDGARLGVDIQYVFEERPLGTGGALGLLPRSLPDLPLIMVNGDILTNIDFRTLLDVQTASNACATMCVKTHEVTIPYGVIEGEGSRISAMVEKPTYRYFVNTGIYAVSAEVYKSVRPGTEIDMPVLLQKFLDKGGMVNKMPTHDYWLDVGRMDDFNKAQADIHTLNLL